MHFVQVLNNVCIPQRHAADGRRSDRNVLVNSGMW